MNKNRALKIADMLLSAKPHGDYSVTLHKRDDPEIITITLDIGGQEREEIIGIVQILRQLQDIDFSIDGYSKIDIYDKPSSPAEKQGEEES